MLVLGLTWKALYCWNFKVIYVREACIRHLDTLYLQKKLVHLASLIFILLGNDTVKKTSVLIFLEEIKE